MIKYVLLIRLIDSIKQISMYCLIITIVLLKTTIPKDSITICLIKEPDGIQGKRYSGNILDQNANNMYREKSFEEMISCIGIVKSIDVNTISFQNRYGQKKYLHPTYLFSNSEGYLNVGDSVEYRVLFNVVYHVIKLSSSRITTLPNKVPSISLKNYKQDLITYKIQFNRLINITDKPSITTIWSCDFDIDRQKYKFRIFRNGKRYPYSYSDSKKDAVSYIPNNKFPKNIIQLDKNEIGYINDGNLKAESIYSYYITCEEISTGKIISSSDTVWVYFDIYKKPHLLEKINVVLKRSQIKKRTFFKNSFKIETNFETVIKYLDDYEEYVDIKRLSDDRISLTCSAYKRIVSEDEFISELCRKHESVYNNDKNKGLEKWEIKMIARLMLFINNKDSVRETTIFANKPHYVIIPDFAQGGILEKRFINKQ